MSLDLVLEFMGLCSVTPSQLILGLLSSRHPSFVHAHADLMTHSGDICAALLVRLDDSNPTFYRIREILERIFQQEIRNLTRIEAGWHFSALHTSHEQIHDFNIDVMAEGIKSLAPCLWSLFGRLLRANSRTTASNDTGELQEFPDNEGDVDQLVPESF